MKKNTVTITNNKNNQTYELPLLSGSTGPDAIDITRLYSQTGLFTYDPGFTSTASCDSKITYIDGDKGVLLHRGYRIEDLVENCNFLQVAHLLLNKNLPNKKEEKKFINEVTHHTMIHEQVKRFFDGFRRDAHPMAVMVGIVGALSAFYPDSTDINDPKQRELAALRLIAKMPTIAAMVYRYAHGLPMNHPRNDLDYASNFLHMTFSNPTEPYIIKPSVAKVMDKIFILHADHEQNASTSTVRISGSSGANPFACIAAGISSLWGPAHGGANEAVLDMLTNIGHKDRIPEFIARAKDKNDPFRLMGFGHRVYKNYDPRASALKKYCDEVLRDLKIDDPLLELAQELERIALEDEYFIKRKLFPNVDFYSGIVLRAIGFPVSMFTVLFALARTVGWIAQWKEMIKEPNLKIGRPRQLYHGKFDRKFKI